jgi:hypothetical protein
MLAVARLAVENTTLSRGQFFRQPHRLKEQNHGKSFEGAH